MDKAKEFLQAYYPELYKHLEDKVLRTAICEVLCQYEGFLSFSENEQKELIKELLTGKTK